MTRMREKGSVVGFIVVGVLLVVLVVGGLYGLKQGNFFGIGDINRRSGKSKQMQTTD